MKETVSPNECKEYSQNKPYVVSADIQILLKSWAVKKGFSLPKSEYFTQLRSEFAMRLGTIFSCYELISEEELSSGLAKILSKNTVLPVSLDRVYSTTFPRLDIARIVDLEGKNRGLGKRADCPTLLSQFKKLKNRGFSEVALVDDVIFTGDLLERVSSLLERIGIAVPYIYAGIGIRDGVNKLLEKGKKVRCVKEYSEVLDEICERDFYPGVPFSGRLVNGSDNTGVPYILPFGNPVEWASIPSESQVSFSRFCINQTIKLFTAIEVMSSKYVRCCDLERKVIGFPNDETRFINALKATL